MNKRTKAVAISPEVKKIVYERDDGWCILCGMPVSIHHANAHVIPRSKGGLGVEQNIVTLCGECHTMYDFSPNRNAIYNIIMKYIIRKYPTYNVQDVTYRKGK